MMQRHGANIYHPNGAKLGLLDFSNSVVSVPAPESWKAQFGKALAAFQEYPQPYAIGLASYIEKAMHLSPGTVMLSNGSSEALSWIAQSLRKQRVIVETPCFGEYAVLLSRFGAKYREIGADEPWSPDWPRLSAAMERAQAFWTANPSNPAGLEMTDEEFQERLEFCRSKGILLILDEALHAQSLNSKGDRFFRRCVEKPGALVVRSLSKGLGLPGLRLGFVAGHPLEIAKLGALQDPWSVGSMAQAMGRWIFDQERRLFEKRSTILQAWKLDLLKRLHKIPPHSLLVRESDTGFFLCRLLGKLDDSRKLSARLLSKGILVRSCASYGGWGTGYIRLNPRSPKDNARLAHALTSIYETL